MSTRETNLPLFDICRSYHGGNAESESANIDIAPKKEKLRDEIKAYITSCGKRGATCYEVEITLGLKHQTASARISELKKEFQVFHNGLKRTTTGTSTAAVYVTSDGQVRGKE